MNNTQTDRLAQLLAQKLIVDRVALANPKLIIRVSLLTELLMAAMIEYEEGIRKLPEIYWEDVQKLLPPGTVLAPAKERMLQEKIMKHQKEMVIRMLKFENLIGNWFDGLDQIPERNRSLLDRLGNAVHTTIDKELKKTKM